MSLEFNRSNILRGTFLYAEAGDDAAQALYVRVSAFLWDRRRWHVRLLPLPVALLFSLASLPLTAAVLFDLFRAPHAPRFTLLVASLIVSPLGMLGCLGALGISYALSAVTRKQRSQRWADQRDKILVALISALIGGILGAVIQRAAG